jgi:DNA repair protein RecN (Recombination protein N)
MLAIKAALMEASAIRTYCFDEIDVGVSGDVATRMAELMAQISKKRQVIVITHLPMVAVLADHLYSVEKTFAEHSTTSVVRAIVSGAERETVLGRLLSDQPNEATTEFVRSLKERHK